MAETLNNLTLPMSSSDYLNVGIAINGDKSGKNIVRWALEKFVPEENVIMKLIHVRSRTIETPTETAYKKELEWKANEMLLPYKRMCSQAQVEVNVVIIESEDVPNAIAAEVAKSGIKKLVIGASNRGIFSRKSNGLSMKISASVPSSCTVYAVSKGNLSSIRHSDADTVASSVDDYSDTRSIVSDTSFASSSQTDFSSIASSTNFSSPSLTMQRFQALSSMNQNLLKTKNNSFESYRARYQSRDIDGRRFNVGSSYASSSGTLAMDANSCFSDRASVSDATTDCSSSERQVNVNLELEKLRIELRHAKGMYAMVQSETNVASRKLKHLNARASDEAKRLEEINAKEEEAKQTLREDNEKRKAAKREAQHVMQSAKREAALRKEVESKATHETKEREKLENAISGPFQQYTDFTWEEIISATSSFTDDLKIGRGGFGTIYKCSFHHTTVAVKILHASDGHKTKQFQRELEILGKTHHPHLLLLIGACVDRGCLVYEYMENGSLEDRLTRKNDSPPIPWHDRFRIAWEVASALAFLHSSKPEPIIHRDLKPANILLDRNLVSKIGDTGLAAMLQTDQGSASSAVYRETGPVGTPCYIDPEYQRTGLISPKSDVYAFGMVILQLLTAKPAMALTHVVEMAIADGNLAEILDRKAGDWPVEETKELAELGLSCLELRRRDRPDLQEQVLPSLLRLREVADKARDSASKVQKLPPPAPTHFICPILKDVMDDPCVAADGYTYDRKGIEAKIEANETSPMTNLPFPSKTLIPNYTLLAAIMEWKSKATSIDC